MTEIREYKVEYNYWIDRYNKAEKYFKSATIEECTRKKILDAFVDTKKFGEKNEKDLLECSICISSQILDKLQTYIVMRKSLVRKNPETGAGSLFSLPPDDFALNSSIKNVEFILKEFLE